MLEQIVRVSNEEDLNSQGQEHLQMLRAMRANVAVNASSSRVSHSDIERGRDRERDREEELAMEELQNLPELLKYDTIHYAIQEPTSPDLYSKLMDLVQIKKRTPRTRKRKKRLKNKSRKK